MSLQPEAVAFNTNASGSSYFFNQPIVITTPATSHIAVTYGGSNFGSPGTIVIPKTGRYLINMTYSVGLSTGTVTAGNMTVQITNDAVTVGYTSSSFNTNTVNVLGDGRDSYFGSAVYTQVLTAGTIVLRAIATLANSADTNTYDLNVGPVYLQYVGN